MRRTVLTFMALLLAAEVAWAQRKPIVPVAAVSDREKLSGKKRVLYLLRQLDLTKEQRAHTRGLIATIIDTGAEPEFSLDQVYALMAEMQEAEANGDEERKREITRQLRELGQPSGNEEDFFMNMESVLTDEQKAQLAEATARLERNPSGSLRPVDVLRAALQLELTEDQQEHVRQLRDKLRQTLRRTRTLRDKQRFQLMNGLLDGILSELTPEQQRQFKLAVAKLRPDLAYRLRVLTEEEEEAFIQERKARGESDPDTEPDVEPDVEHDVEHDVEPDDE